MKERPILFSTPMVQAILAGRKTMTRRIIKPQPSDDYSILHCGLYHPTQISRKGDEYPCIEVFGAYTDDGQWGSRCKYGMPGDRLWVRETFMPAVLGMDDGGLDQYGYLYRADGDLNNALIEQMEDQSWKPSIHMPRIASRITLDITHVRVERLQDISEEDAITEGVESWIEDRLRSKPTHYKLYHHEPGDDSFYSSSAIDSFATLWQSINGPESWQSNPWVWVISFKKIKP